MQLKITWSRKKFKYNTNYTKARKKVGITNVIKSFKIPFTLFPLQKRNIKRSSIAKDVVFILQMLFLFFRIVVDK